jgi:hypothetical protein
MFLGYFLAQILNRSFFDVPLHVCAVVCLALIGASPCEVQSVTSTSKNQTSLPIIPLRQRSSSPDAFHHETTSTRIPILSP